MILDIDHIALSYSDFSKFIQVFSELDYKPQFYEKKIKNPIIKRKLMKNFSLNHDLCLLNSKSNINIELLCHDTTNHDNGFITPIFEYPKQFKNMKEFNLKLKPIEIPYILKQSKNNFSFNKFVVQSNNVEKSKIFWNILGFKNIDQKKNQYLFESILSSKKYELFIELTKSRKNYFLDDSGWNSIAFLTNSIRKEKKCLEEKYETSKIESLLINKKELEIFFVKGPSNELVEIISII